MRLNVVWQLAPVTTFKILAAQIIFALEASDYKRSNYQWLYQWINFCFKLSSPRPCFVVCNRLKTVRKTERRNPRVVLV